MKDWANLLQLAGLVFGAAGIYNNFTGESRLTAALLATAYAFSSAACYILTSREGRRARQE